MEAIRLLGPLELWAQGRRHELGSLKEQSALAILSLECGRPVSVDALIARIWDEAPPAQARDNLISYISRLRRRLREAAGDRVHIDSRSGSYVLVADPDTVDLLCFRRLRRQARAISESGDHEQAGALLRTAEDLWLGEPLGGLPGDWMQRIREGLEDEHRAAQLEFIEVELRLGHHASVIGELRQLVAQHPLDEAVAILLMTALYRSNRVADALEIYQRIRRSLLTELGAEPGSRLRDVHQQILRSDPELAVTPRYRRRNREPQPNTLPPDIPDFIGREQELAALMDDSPDGTSMAAVYVVEGMAGIGKSAVAIRAAHRLADRCPDAQLYVRLFGHEAGQRPKAAAAALAELLRMLGIAPTRIPPTLSGRAELWHEEMADRRAIIVLDDAANAEQVRPLITRAAGCRTFITTRRKLHGLHGATHVRLDPLPADDAAALFVQVAAEAEKHHDPEGDVSEIVRRCGYLPLAIILAAGRFHHDNPTELADFVDDLVSADASPGSGGGGSAVRAPFELSYRKLDTAQQRVFRALGLAPFQVITEHAAAALVGQEAITLRPLLNALIDYNLLLDAGQRAVRFHDLLRYYARDLAYREDSSQHRRRSLTRLLNYYVTAADRADRMLYPHRRRTGAALSQHTVNVPAMNTQQEAQAWMSAEWHNALLVAEYAIGHERQRDGAFLVHAMGQFLETHGHWTDATAAQELALLAYRELGDLRGVGQAALELAFTQFRTGHHDSALHHANEALTVHRSLSDRHAEAETLDIIGIILWSTAHFREALAHHQEALNFYREIGDRRGEADALAHSGLSYWHLGRYDESISHLGNALEMYRRIGDRRGEARVLNNLGDAKQHRGYHRDAAKLYQESLRIFAEISGRQNNAILLHNMGNVYQYKGHYREALRHYRLALATFDATGDRRSTAAALNNIGTTYRLMERYSESLIHYEKALALAEQIADLYEKTRALCGIADTKQETGNYDVALSHYIQALSNAREIGDTYQEGRIHDGIASVVLHQSGHEAARIHWRQALDLFQLLDVPEAQSVAIRLQAIGGMAS